MLYQDDVPFFWKGGQIIMTGYTEEDLRNFIVASEGVEITGFSIAEGEVEGARIFDSFYLEVDETAPSSVINIIAHANVEGLTAQKEVIIRGEYPVALRLKVADESESGNDLVINQVENERGVYQGDVTIPAGAGDFRFKFVDTEYPDREYGVSISLEGTSGRGEIHDWSDDYMTIPASLRGETFTFRINLPRERIEVYQGENPFVTTVTPVEGNPEYAVANRNTPGFMFKVTPADASFDLETDVDGIYASRYSGGDGLYNVHIDIENWVMNSGSRTFNLIFKDGEEIARFPIEARYVSVESVSAPEEIVIHEGEFAQYTFNIKPENNSEQLSFGIWPGFPSIFGLSECRLYDEQGRGGNIITLLGIREGNEGLVGIRHKDDENNYFCQTRVTVLPKEAAVAEHIFHAQMNDGDMLSLKLSQHSDCTGNPINWTSSNTDVVTVDDNGTVSAVSTGNAVITADCGKHRVMMGVAVNGGSDVEQIKENLRIYGHNGIVYVSGAEPGTKIRIVSVDGIVETSAESKGSVDTFNVGNGIHLINVGDEVLKLSM